jgi:hypothetical protein
VATAQAKAGQAVAGLDRTMARAAALADEDRHRRVDGEWSAVESMRHLVLVIDLWLSKAILGDPDPFHPMALPPTFMPPKLPGTSIDPEARPTFEEACETLRQRLGRVRAYVDDELTSEALARPVSNHAETVAGALGVLFQELAAHEHFMNRDLDLLERSAST